MVLGCWRWWLLHKVERSIIGTTTSENNLALACRVEHTNKQQLIPLLRIYPGNSCTCVKDVYKAVQRSVVHNNKTNENPDVRNQEKELILNCGLFPQYNKYYGAMKMSEL